MQNFEAWEFRCMRRGFFYQQIATLHAKNIDQGFLSVLGQPFLALVYEAIDEAPSSVLLVEEREGMVLGFVAGGVGMGSIYRRLLRKPGALIRALGPSLLQPARVWRMLEVLRYGAKKGGEAREQLPAAELLSIAVAPDFRGQGVAESLYRRLVEYFRSNGVVEFRIVVGNTLPLAHRFYRRMGAVPRGSIEVHSGEESTIFVHVAHEDF